MAQRAFDRSAYVRGQAYVVCMCVSNFSPFTERTCAPGRTCAHVRIHDISHSLCRTVSGVRGYAKRNYVPHKEQASIIIMTIMIGTKFDVHIYICFRNCNKYKYFICIICDNNLSLVLNLYFEYSLLFLVLIYSFIYSF